MSNYQRLISYIYTYEGGIKGKNIGFAKLDTRGSQSRLTVNVKKIFVGGNPMGIYLLSNQGELRIGTLFARNGAGEFRTTVNASDIEESGRSIEEFYGLSVHDVESAWRSYTTIWEDAVTHAAEVELADVTSENLIKKREERDGIVIPQDRTLHIAQEIEEELEPESFSVNPPQNAALEAVSEPPEIKQMETRQPDFAQQSSQQPLAQQPSVQTSAVPQPETLDYQIHPEPVKLETASPEPRMPGLELCRMENQASSPVFPGMNMPQSQPACTPETDISVPDDSASETKSMMPGTWMPGSGTPVMKILEPEHRTGMDRNTMAGKKAELCRPESRRPEPPPEEPQPDITDRIPSFRDEKEIRSHQEIWDFMRKRHAKIQAFEYEDGCEILTMKPQDIGLLPRDTWIFGNNSFLLHGYYNYRYLILARLENPDGMPRYLLGVPGNYVSSEKYMASMFGFTDFVLSKKQPSRDSRFGYWYTDIRIGE